MSDYLNRDFGSVDTVDVIAVFMLVVGAAVMSEFAIIEVAGHSLNTVVHTFGTATEITSAMVLPVIGLGLAISTNEFDRESYEAMSTGEQAAIGVVLVGLLAFTFSPDLALLITDHIAGQVIYTGSHGVAGLVIASE